MINNLASSFGAEIGKIDLSQTTVGEIDVILESLHEHQMLFFGNQSLTLDEQIDLTNKLGSIEVAWEDKHPDSEYVQLLSNFGKKTVPFKSTSKHWHVDRSFHVAPSGITVLHCLSVSPSSAATEFVDMRAAASLPQYAQFNHTPPQVLPTHLKSTSLG